MTHENIQIHDVINKSKIKLIDLDSKELIRLYNFLLNIGSNKKFRPYFLNEIINRLSN